jgi:hypothetical protein
MFLWLKGSERDKWIFINRLMSNRKNRKFTQTKYQFDGFNERLLNSTLAL